MLTNWPKNTVWFVLCLEQHWEINCAEHSSWAKSLEVSMCFMFDLSEFQVLRQNSQKAFPNLTKVWNTHTVCIEFSENTLAGVPNQRTEPVETARHLSL